MKILFALVAVVLLASIIDAAPKPTASRKPEKTVAARPRTSPIRITKSTSLAGKAQQKKADKNKRQIPFFLPGNAGYPNYYEQPSSPVIDFQGALQAAFLSGVHYAELEKYLKKQNLTDPSGKPLPLDAKTLAAFEASFGDKVGDAKNATDLQGKLISFENISGANLVNPFLLANGFDDKVVKSGNGVPSFKGGKLGDVNGSVVALVNPYQSGNVNALFGPELAPRYEIHYSPAQGLTLDPIQQFAGAGINSAAFGVAPVGPGAYGPGAYGPGAYGPSAFGPAAIDPAAYGPEVGPYSGFGIAPSFNSLLNPYPYPYPFLPGFDPKGLKPNGKGNNGKKPDSTGQPTDSTSPTYPDASSTEATPSESSSEPSSDSSASEAPQ